MYFSMSASSYTFTSELQIVFVVTNVICQFRD